MKIKKTKNEVEQFAAGLRMLMAKNGTSNDTIARITNACKNSVYNWTHAVCVPSQKRIRAIADHFKVTADFFTPGEQIEDPVEEPVKEQVKEPRADARIAYRLRTARVKAGLSEYDVSEATDIDRRILWNYENAKRPVKLYHLIALASVYGTTVERLKGEDGTPDIYTCDKCGAEIAEGARVYSIDNSSFYCADCMRDHAARQIWIDEPDDVANMFGYTVVTV